MSINWFRHIGGLIRRWYRKNFHKDWKVFARLYNDLAYAQNRFFEQLSKAYYYLSEQ